MSPTLWRLGYITFGLLWAGIVGAGLFAAKPVSASPLAADSACRGCHGDNQRQLTLPSGETLSLLVELTRLDASAHSSTNPDPVSCRACHTGAARYRYPHEPNPAPDHQAYRAAAAQVCQACHYPHNPFHKQTPADAQTPTCVDCHGSHQVERVANIQNSMPANCLTCHTDQTDAWASDLLAPRPGLGQGAEGYAGSSRCLACHADIYLTWRETRHARVIQNPARDPHAVVGDFSLADPNLTFALSDVAYTIGGRWKQQYLTRTVEGKLQILPATWHVAAQEWVTDTASSGLDWQQACSGCHVTGLDTTTLNFVEFGVGCESCHGPSAAHIADPETVKPFAAVDDQVCGACHSRGSSAAGLPFPASFRPGEKLTDHFTFTTDPNHVWPDGSARSNYQQYMDWQLGSEMAQAESTSCLSCHKVHDAGVATAQLKAPVNTLCVECHHDKHALYKHTPYHQQASTKRTFTCTDCHMPKLATNAVSYDMHNHSFLQPTPQASLDHGGLTQMPNACNQCHTQADNDAAWAVQTISHSKALGAVGKKNVFGIGPTPTSPPPPTPLPSVGAQPEAFAVDTLGWVRTAGMGLLGLLVLLTLWIIYQIRQARRSRHA